MTDPTKPLPCPFCGNLPELLKGGSFLVRCSHPDCGVRVEAGPRGSAEEAISLWNTRTSSVSSGEDLQHRSGE